MATQLVRKIREIEQEIILTTSDAELTYDERMQRTWELQGRLRLAHSRLVEAIEEEEAQAA